MKQSNKPITLITESLHGIGVGVEIENPELVKTQKSIFQILWKLAKPI